MAFRKVLQQVPEAQEACYLFLPGLTRKRKVTVEIVEHTLADRPSETSVDSFLRAIRAIRYPEYISSVLEAEKWAENNFFRAKPFMGHIEALEWAVFCHYQAVVARRCARSRAMILSVDPPATYPEEWSLLQKYWTYIRRDVLWLSAFDHFLKGPGAWTLDQRVPPIENAVKNEAAEAIARLSVVAHKIDRTVDNVRDALRHEQKRAPPTISTDARWMLQFTTPAQSNLSSTPLPSYRVARLAEDCLSVNGWHTSPTVDFLHSPDSLLLDEHCLENCADLHFTHFLRSLLDNRAIASVIVPHQLAALLFEPLLHNILTLTMTHWGKCCASTHVDALSTLHFLTALDISYSLHQHNADSVVKFMGSKVGNKLVHIKAHGARVTAEQFVALARTSVEHSLHLLDLDGATNEVGDDFNPSELEQMCYAWVNLATAGQRANMFGGGDIIAAQSLLIWKKQPTPGTYAAMAREATALTGDTEECSTANVLGRGRRVGRHDEKVPGVALVSAAVLQDTMDRRQEDIAEQRQGASKCRHLFLDSKQQKIDEVMCHPFLRLLDEVDSEDEDLQ